MKSASNRFSGLNAFTLIELLVVIGIIAVLAAGIGVALRDNNPSASLRGAQSLLNGALSAARGQAALSQSNARILIQADASRDDFLRSIRVVVPDSSAPGSWRQVGADILLPESIYVVPPTTTFTGVIFNTDSGPWNAGRNSTFLKVAAAADVVGLSNAVAGSSFVSQDITSLGSVSGSGRIVVTPGRRTGPSSVTLDNPSAVRGLFVSIYGVPALINEADSFDQN